MDMLEKDYIKEYLQKTFCYKCGTSLGSAKLETIAEAPVALIAHAVCPKCQAESMVTITSAGGGASPMLSDLNVTEFKKFMGVKSVAHDELLDLHKILKRKSLWSLLVKKEKSLEKKQKI